MIPHREIYNLSLVSGPVLKKMKGTSWIFIFLGSKSGRTSENIDEIGQMLVSGALDDTKTIGKAAADIFAKSGPEKTQTNRRKS